MERKSKVRISATRGLPNPTEYVQLLDGELRDWAFNEERAPEFKDRWRTDVYKVPNDVPLDLEIGTGNGYFFAHHANGNPTRCFVGIELKYKPLIQSIKRALRGGAKNVRILRYDAWAIDELFSTGELNDIFIHFPDPWEKKRQWKHRLIDDEFMGVAHELQRPNTVIDFKTDSLDYFEWAMERFKRSPYKVEAETRDLYQSPYLTTNFITHFEKLWTEKNLKINYARLRKP